MTDNVYSGEPSLPANGSRERAPDDRLQRVIQYSRGGSDPSKGRGVLDAPLSRA